MNMAVQPSGFEWKISILITFSFCSSPWKFLKSHFPEFIDEFIKEAFSCLKENLPAILSYLSLERKMVRGLGALRTLNRNWILAMDYTKTYLEQQMLMCGLEFSQGTPLPSPHPCGTMRKLIDITE